MSRGRAVNLHYEECDVRIDRRTRWGNPFRMRRESDRAEVIVRYREHLEAEITAGRITADGLVELHGKRLGCWCAPKPCHGDVLAEFAEHAVRGELLAPWHG